MTDDDDDDEEEEVDEEDELAKVDNVIEDSDQLEVNDSSSEEELSVSTKVKHLVYQQQLKSKQPPTSSTPKSVKLAAGTKTLKKTTKITTNNNDSTTDIDFLLDLGDLNLNDSSSTVPSVLLQPFLQSTPSPPANPAPYRIVESAEQLSFKEFSLLEVPHNFKVTYRFPRINDQARTLVELIIKNGLPCEEKQYEAEQPNNKIQIQAPENGSIIFKAGFEVCSLQDTTNYKHFFFFLFTLDCCQFYRFYSAFTIRNKINHAISGF